jgi:hypothetical protein
MLGSNSNGSRFHFRRSQYSGNSSSSKSTDQCPPIEQLCMVRTVCHRKVLVDSSETYQKPGSQRPRPGPHLFDWGLGLLFQCRGSRIWCSWLCSSKCEVNPIDASLSRVSSIRARTSFPARIFKGATFASTRAPRPTRNKTVTVGSFIFSSFWVHKFCLTDFSSTFETPLIMLQLFCSMIGVCHAAVGGHPPARAFPRPCGPRSGLDLSDVNNCVRCSHSFGGIRYADHPFGWRRPRVGTAPAVALPWRFPKR